MILLTYYHIFWVYIANQPKRKMMGCAVYIPNQPDQTKLSTTRLLILVYFRILGYAVCIWNFGNKGKAHKTHRKRTVLYVESFLIFKEVKVKVSVVWELCAASQQDFIRWEFFSLCMYKFTWRYTLYLLLGCLYNGEIDTLFSW